jgi:uncharacterized damage-inducible protein DinB
MTTFTRQGLKALHAWTHDRLDLVVEYAARLPAEAFARQLPGFGYSSVRAQLVHVLQAEANWIHVLQGLAYDPPPDSSYPTAHDVGRLKRQVMAETLAYLDSLPEPQLNTDLVRPPEGWVGPLRSPAFILHHIATHAFHHKGQIAAMFRLLDAPIGDTDLQREE